MTAHSKTSLPVALVLVLVLMLLHACVQRLPIVDDDEAQSDRHEAEAIGEATPLSVTRPVYRTAAAHDYYRLDLRKSGDKIAIVRTSEVSTRVQPLPALAYDYVVAVIADDLIKAVLPVRFADSARSWTLDPEGQSGESEMAVTEAIASVYVERIAGLQRLELRSGDWELLLSVEAEALASPGQGGGVDVNKQALSQDDLAFLYPHIVFMGPGDEYLLPRDPILEGRPLEPISDAAADVIAEALEGLPSGLLSAIQGVGLSRLDKPSTWGYSTGSQLFLNVAHAADPMLVPTIVHEATHIFAQLSDDVAQQTWNTEQWPSEAIDAARAVNSQYRLLRGLTQTWTDLHQTGVRKKVSGDYAGEPAWQQLDDHTALNMGFASAYGAKSKYEDLAEYAKTVFVYERMGSSDMCSRFAGISELDKRLFIPYAKLNLLAGVGVISDDGFRKCMNGFELTSQDGIHLQDSRSFDRGLRAGFSYQHGHNYYNVYAASDGGYEALLQIALRPGEESPLGLHKLEAITFRQLEQEGLTGFYVSNEEPLKARLGALGLVLVSESSETRIAGAVFGLSLISPAGFETDAVPLARFRVSQ